MEVTDIAGNAAQSFTSDWVILKRESTLRSAGAIRMGRFSKNPWT
jgi:hypothetical protein